MLGNPELNWSGWTSHGADKTVPASVMRPLLYPPPTIISLDPIWASCQSRPSSILITNHMHTALPTSAPCVCWHGALPRAWILLCSSSKAAKLSGLKLSFTTCHLKIHFALLPGWLIHTIVSSWTINTDILNTQYASSGHMKSSFL